MTGVSLRRLGWGLVLIGAMFAQTAAAQARPSAQSPTADAPRAHFSGETASDEARQVADWVIQTADNGGSPFVIVDKVNAKVFVFDDLGQLQGASAALLGLATGDGSVSGVGDRALSSIRREQRTTPAGRFVASLGQDFDHKGVLWIDYAAGVALHPVVTTNPAERRLQRLATASPLDNRISFGCINVPARFYESVVSPAFSGTSGIVYILPEVRSLRETFFDHGRARNPDPAASASSTP